MTTQDRIRAAGGIVHKDGNIFFKNAEQFLAAAQKVPLTGEQIDAALDSIDPCWWDVPSEDTERFARAIEAAHGITPATGTQESKS